MSDVKSKILNTRVSSTLVERVDAAGARLAPGVALSRSVVVRALLERGAASVENDSGHRPGDSAA